MTELDKNVKAIILNILHMLKNVKESISMMMRKIRYFLKRPKPNCWRWKIHFTGLTMIRPEEKIHEFKDTAVETIQNENIETWKKQNRTLWMWDTKQTNIC